MNQLDDLDDFLAGDEPDYTGEVQAPPDAPNAARLLRRLGIVYRRIEEVNDAFDLRRLQLEGWRDAQLERLTAQTTWLEEALVRYHAAVLAKEPDRLNISLPDGDLVSRMGQPKWEFTDEQRFIAWCVENNRPELLRYAPAPPPEIDKKEVKKALTVRDEKGRPIMRGVVPVAEEDVDGLQSYATAPGLTVHEAQRKFTPVPKGFVLAVQDDEEGVA